MSLPKNWVETRLENVIFYKKGKKPKILKDEEFDNSLPYLDIKAFEKGEIRRYADKASSNLIDENDIGIVWDGARSGWVSYGKSGAIGSTIAKLTPLKIESTFLYRFLQSKFEYLNSNTRGTGIPHVDPQILWNLKFPLPPLAEQERIVAKLDVLFGQIDVMKQSLERIPQLLANFKQQVLTLAVTGKLTEAWREGKELKDWEETNIGSLFSVKTGATPKRGEQKYYDGGDIPWLKSGQVKNELIYEAEEFITDLAIKETNTKVFPIDTLLVAMYGEGKTRGQVGWMKIEAATNQAIAALVNENLDIRTRSYTYYFCLSQYNEIRAQAEGGNQPNLNLSKIKNWKIQLPPLQEQKEIVNRVESLFAKADAIEAQYQSLKTKIDSLPQAILHKAFKGELVPQLPTDGDAKELLKEIEKLKAEAKPKKKSTKKKTYTKTKTSIPQAAEPDRAGYENDLKIK
ncbi:restriction endonuclease subunit S [Formosa sp. A9]|uniref:restriction endonuclease subunit S n=1 Tax=Formosa sp. A9 TaxID=3442641 RepID=UPI003EBFCED7